MDARFAQQTILTPNSGTIFASPAPSYPVKREDGDDEDNGDGDGDDEHHGNGSGHSNSNTASPTEPHRKKQKRNKPTLSCYECVERKTKASVLSPRSSPLPPCRRSFRFRRTSWRRRRCSTIMRRESFPLLTACN